jgi:deoxycytidylate deaminase
MNCQIKDMMTNTTKPIPMLALPPDYNDEDKYIPFSTGKGISKQVQNCITIIEELYVKPCRRHNTSLHVAFIVRRGKIMSIASNSVGSRKKGCGYGDRTIHAEMAALKKVDWRELDGADMYVFRWRTSEKNIAYSLPCYNCSTVLNKCIKNWGLKKIYYSIDPDNYNANAYAERTSNGKKIKPVSASSSNHCCCEKS